MLKALMLRSTLVAFVCSVTFTAHAIADAPKRIDVPAGELVAALEALSRQAPVDLVFQPEQLKRFRTDGVSGNYTPEDAIRILLKGTPLQLRTDSSSGAMVIAPAAPQTSAVSRAGRGPQGEGSFWSRLRLAQVDASSASQAERRSEVASNEEGKEDQQPVKRAALEELIVTGTHIKGIGNATAPVLTFDREAIERTGYSTTEDLLESVPQNFGGGQAGASADGLFGNGAFRLLNYSAGTGINLRGIGASSTLVLVNGHRVAPAALGTFVDISAIPLSAVERVEILTDGSSAIYGSDAVAGVVNILLKKDYSGVEASARYGSASGGTREETTLAGSLGTHWSGGGGVIALQHQDMAPLLTRERSFASGVRQPSTLLPETVNSSMLMNLGQDIGERARLGVDALYTHRDVWAQEAVSFIPAVDTSDVKQDGFSVAPTLQVALSDRWSLDINPLFAKQRLDKQLVRRFQAGMVDTSSDVSTFELSSLDVLTNFGLMQLPAGELSVATGAAYRDEQFDDDFQGLGGFDAKVSVGRNVTSAFAEFHVPLAKVLDLSAAVRWDSYSDFGDTTNPRIGLLWSVGETLKVRGSYSHSFRAPTVMELNTSSQGTVGVIAFDFVAPSGVGNVPALLMSGARTDLEPERAKTTSFGFDFAPAAVRGLIFGATYYRIDYTDRILTPPFARTVLTRPDVYGGLISTFASDAEVQAFVNAAVATGASFFDGTAAQTGIAGVRHVYDIRQQNAAKLRQDGFDLTAAYRVDLGGVGLSLRLNATNVQHILTSYRGASQDADQVATYGNPPKVRLRGDVGLDTRIWSLNAALNSYDGYTNNLLAANQPVDSWLTLDLSARLDFGAWLAAPAANGLTLQLSAQNILDEDPPFVDLGLPQSVRYDSANASPLGRFLALQLRKQW
ncbi:MAG TPA: TonB-dependent receptor [Steroidobacteraceae bacterium]|nr:TonB-dependent receptor [Steroidobacteraceae bacterium]